ncbi:MAG: ankyrin repeat domain-containing protein, partial [Vicinamibacterales bacterium]
PNVVTPEGYSVLMAAARTGNVRLVRALLARGANVDAREGWQEQTALMLAAAENHGDVVRVLVEAGADVNLPSRVLDGAPPRQRAAADVGQQGVHVTFPKGGLTAVHFAARQNAPDAVAALADAGADLDARDPDGFTPVILATLSGNYDVAALLLERGAGLNTADISGRTPLYAAVDMNTYEYSMNRPTPKPSGRMSAVDLVKFILARKPDVNARLTDRVRPPKYDTAGNPNLTAGATAFMKAASTSDVELMRLLLDAGADPFVRNAQRSTALAIVAGLNWRRIGSLGSEAESIEAMTMLLDLGMDINGFNDLGQTALHGAMMRGYGPERGDNEGVSTVPSINVVKFLVARGARIDAKDKAGRTPADLAAAVGNDEAVALFQSLRQ